MKNQKICIIGDGLTGLTAALALKNLNLDIDIFYQKNNSKIKKDNRTTAISESNYQFLTKDLKINFIKKFWPSKKMHLYHENNSKLINFLNYEDNSANVMYIFKNHEVKNEIIKILKKKKKVKFINQSIKNINYDECSLKINKTKVFYDLIILCLGNKSALYKGIDNNRAIAKDYKEMAVTCEVKHNLEIKNASQYFLKEGPLAILPFHKNKFSLVWSVSKIFYNNVNNIKKLIGSKLDMIYKDKVKAKISATQTFPIHLNLKTKYYKKRVLMLGEGIHAIHPIAGQGFNLILRDINKLTKIIDKNLSLGMTIKNSFVLEDFYNSRSPENTIFSLGINFTNSFFKENKYLEPIKKTILNEVGKNKNIKRITRAISDRGFSL
jgi:2-octaprenyl-6-methoxyphenol hydroxylase